MPEEKLRASAPSMVRIVLWVACYICLVVAIIGVFTIPRSVGGGLGLLAVGVGLGAPLVYGLRTRKARGKAQYAAFILGVLVAIAGVVAFVNSTNSDEGVTPIPENGAGANVSSSTSSASSSTTPTATSPGAPGRGPIPPTPAPTPPAATVTETSNVTTTVEAPAETVTAPPVSVTTTVQSVNTVTETQTLTVPGGANPQPEDPQPTDTGQGRQEGVE